MTRWAQRAERVFVSLEITNIDPGATTTVTPDGKFSFRWVAARKLASHRRMLCVFFSHVENETRNAVYFRGARRQSNGVALKVLRSDGSACSKRPIGTAAANASS
jgi:hypothetical protein